MFNYRNVVLYNFDEPSETLKELHGIFSETLNKDLSYRAFRFYLFWHRPHMMDITFIRHNGSTVGFVCVTFYKHIISGKVITICRGATGITEAFRGGGLPSRVLCAKYIHYRMRHPFERMYITGYMANPILYAMICRYTHLVYPKPGVHIPGKINKLRDDLVRFYGLQRKVVAPWVLKIHFQVELSPRDERRIHESKDKHVQFYLSLNGNGFMRQQGILAIVPVSWYNVFVSLWIITVQKPVLKGIKKYWPVVHNISKKWKLHGRDKAADTAG